MGNKEVSMKSNDSDWLKQQAEMLVADFMQKIAEDYPKATAEEKEKLLTEKMLTMGWMMSNIIDEVEKLASCADLRVAVISFPE